MSTTNELERTKARNLAESLRAKVAEMTAELMDRNINAIASELLHASDASGGFTLRFGLQIVNEQVAVEVGISWSRKFSDKEESTFPLSDPSRPELPGMGDDTKMTIRTGDMEVETSTAELQRAIKKLSR